MRTHELGLLMMFDAIMTEGSITKAAERLSMTQPAVSNAVARMRLVWKDELFVKDGRRIQPTLFAHNMWREIKEPMQALNKVVEPKTFDPKTSTRTFRLAISSGEVDITWSKLRKILKEEAPNVDVHAIPYTVVNGEQVLVDAEVDLVIGSAVISNSAIFTEFLYQPNYVCIMSNDNPLAKRNLSMEEFANVPQALVTLSGDTTGYTDQVLAQHGLKRRIAMTVNHFSAVPILVENSDLIAVVPPTTVEEAIFNKRVTVKNPPVEIPGPLINCFWHKRQQNDRGLTWLRTHVNRIIKEHALNHYEKLETFL